ncbi:hypothetical protein VP01_1161g2 [Puccinia sorghi]|uniref:Uncharacterized protein n=1 Tax=Puccinia sorghi TaxID=27349 RepID=A0A0L6VRM4_9BASI|nr:hypothetical protein VP01_1161g2 [Puccinia sorghi]
MGICHYRVGPTLGSLLAITIYLTLKWHKYWPRNDGQDTDEACKSPALFCEEKIPAGLPTSARCNRWPSIGQISSDHCIGFGSPGTKFSSFSSQRSPPDTCRYGGTRPA